MAKSCIGWRSTLIKMGTRKKLYAACDDLDHFASIQFHSVACLHVYGRFLESFLVTQNNPLVRFDLACPLMRDIAIIGQPCFEFD